MSKYYVIRIGKAFSSAPKWMQEIGAILPVKEDPVKKNLKYKHDFRLEYGYPTHNDYHISKKNFRLLTDEEIDYMQYYPDLRNVEDIKFLKDKAEIPDFCVKSSNSIKFEEYREIALKYKIPFNKSWSGNSTYYGVNKGASWCCGTSWKEPIDPQYLEKLIIYKNKFKNETTRVFNTESKGQIGSCCSSTSKKRQIKTGSRPSGDRITARTVKTRVRGLEISPSIISC